MKRKILILFCAVIPLCVFAKTQAWGTLGFQYGNYWEQQSTHNKDIFKEWIGSPGVVFNAYSFFNNKKIGLFVANSFLIPDKSVETVGDKVFKDSVKNLDFKFLFEFGIGPAFRYNIINKLDFHTGLGLNISVLSMTLDRMLITSPSQSTPERVQLKRVFLGLGIMSDIGLKYNITNVIYFDIGTKLALGFANYYKTILNSTVYSPRWSSDYISFYLHPYVGIGFSIPF